MSTSQKRSNPEEIIWDGVNDNKSWWRKRSSLERKLIMALIGVVIITIGVLMYMGMKPAEGINNESDCDTPECVVAASELINRLDKTIDPCDDFFKFACGKFIKNTVKEDIDQELLTILKSPESNDDHYLLKNEKRLFQTCINESELEEESMPIIHSMIRELNDWPVVVGHKWRERQFDWVDTVIKLKKSGYHDSMILNIYKGTTGFSNSPPILEVLPGWSTYVRKEHKEAYIKYMGDVAEMFGAEPNRAAIEMEKVSDMMEKLSEVNLEHNIRFTNIKQISGNYWKTNKTKMSIREFQDEYDDIDWFKLITAFLAPRKVAISDYGEFPNLDVMEAFLTLMSKTPKRVQANYIIWSVIEKLIPFMPKSFRELEANYTCATNSKSPEIDREKLCQKTVEELFVVPPSRIVYTRKHLSKEKQENIGVVFNNIRDEVRNLIENLVWITETERNNIIEKLNDTSVVIGTEWNYEDDSVFEKYEPNNHKRSFRGSFLNMYLNRKKQKKSFVLESFENQMDIFMNSYTTGTLPVYYERTKKLELPVGMFQKQLYKPEGPMYLTYSVLGKSIALELIHTFTFDTNRTFGTPDTLLNFNEQAKCFLKSDEDIIPQNSLEDFLYTRDGVLANIVGLKAAYNLYQSYVQENGEEAIPLGVEFTPNQLFWIASVSYECYESEDDPLQGIFQKMYQKNIPFANSEDFANDFSCSSESKMNKVDKCKMEE
ncbi:hypothetical protein FQR65_LT06860 [Abscondita terminalis]|nr:hypothetical protein FQR65_LT06860 [Abscondita terminalis]